MADFEILTERPAAARAPQKSIDLSNAIMATAETGGAVKFSLNGEPLPRIWNRMANRFGRRGLRLRLRKQSDGSVIAWAEHLNEKAGA